MSRISGSVSVFADSRVHLGPVCLGAGAMKTDAPVAPLPPGFESDGLAGQSSSDCSHYKIKVC